MQFTWHIDTHVICGIYASKFKINTNTVHLGLGNIKKLKSLFVFFLTNPSWSVLSAEWNLLLPAKAPNWSREEETRTPQLREVIN